MFFFGVAKLSRRQHRRRLICWIVAYTTNTSSAQGHGRRTKKGLAGTYNISRVWSRGNGKCVANDPECDEVKRRPRTWTKWGDTPAHKYLATNTEKVSNVGCTDMHLCWKRLQVVRVLNLCTKHKLEIWANHKWIQQLHLFSNLFIGIYRSFRGITTLKCYKWYIRRIKFVSLCLNIFLEIVWQVLSEGLILDNGFQYSE